MDSSYMVPVCAHDTCKMVFISASSPRSFFGIDVKERWGWKRKKPKCQKYYYAMDKLFVIWVFSHPFSWLLLFFFIIPNALGLNRLVPTFDATSIAEYHNVIYITFQLVLNFNMLPVSVCLQVVVRCVWMVNLSQHDTQFECFSANIDIKKTPSSLPFFFYSASNKINQKSETSR